MPTLSSCRGSPTCDGAATRWCWNRRAPARCSKFAIRRSRPPWPCCLRRNKSSSCVGRTDFPGVELLALLLDCQILFKVGAGDSGLRLAEGDHSLALWDFHDLLFHTRSTEGRHANPLGGVYPYVGVISPLPAVRPSWPGKKIDLRKFSAAHPEAISPVAKLLRERHSTRSFDDQRPITLAELSQFLDGTARVLSRSNGKLDLDDGGHAVRPYPSAGAAYELELYLAVDTCEGLARGFYHYDAGAHALAPIGVPGHELEALLAGAEIAMGAPAAPQILITIAARFGRISWKYSSIAYALILKDVGVLMQTLYLMATDMGLGGCAIGIANIDLFAKMTGIEFHVEGPVGQFAIGRGAKSELPTDDCAASVRPATAKHMATARRSRRSIADHQDVGGSAHRRDRAMRCARTNTIALRLRLSSSANMAP